MSHLLLDGKFNKLPEVQDVHWLLTVLPEAIKMTPITPPSLYWDADNIIGIRVIAESHISIHIQKSSSTFFADVFSCKEFSIADATACVARCLDVATMRTNLVSRLVPK